MEKNKKIVPLVKISFEDALYSVFYCLFNEKQREFQHIKFYEDEQDFSYGYVIGEYIVIPYPLSFEIYNKSDLIFV